MALDPGTRLGPYEILAAVGAGGMGEVYRARDTRLDRTVAVKVLPQHVAADPELKRRFEREAKTLATLSHPHICPVFDVGEQDGIDFLVMEYLEGETLAERLAKGPLSLDQALRYAIEIADALDQAHRAGIVHRDLKPGNVMLTKAGARLLDFGLAKSSRPALGGSGLSMLPTTPPGLTAQGTILGTFQYMAPEQLDGKDADGRTDIFAFGAVLYEMFTGKKAFQAKSHASLIGEIMHAIPPPISALQPVAPAALDRLVKICLAKEPHDRWQSVNDLTRELKWIAEGGAQAAPQGPLVAGRTHRELVAWSLVAIVSGFAGVLGWIALDRRNPAAERSVRATLLLPENWSARGITPSSRMALAPDGSRLAFAAIGPDRRSMLWVRRLDALSAQPLAGTDGALLPFWSPDSQFVGFFAGGKLKKIDASGGPVIPLCDASNTPRGGAWNRDGVILFSSSGAGLQRVSASGGLPASMTNLQGQEDTRELPFFLPDGQHFLYRVVGTSGTVSAGTEIRIGSLGSPESQPLLKGVSQAMYAQGHLLFGRDETLMAQAFDAQRLEISGEPVPLAEQVLSPSGYSAFSVSQNGVLVHQDASLGASSRLVWVDRDGKELATLGEDADYGDVQLSPDGMRAAVSLPVADNNSRDVWIFDLARGFPTPFTSNAANDLAAIWSPDNGRVVFNSSRAGHLDLYEKASTMVGDETVLLADSRDKYPVSWSLDDRFILYYGTGGGNQDLWVLPLFGDRKSIAFTTSQFSETAGQFSPNVKWIAYVSNESGRNQVWVAPFPGPGRRIQISTAGVSGGYPRWRRDGKELYYLDSDSRLVAVQVSAEASELRVGTVRPLFETRAKSNLRGYPYDVSADGQRFLINQILETGVPPITLVVNWPALLKK